MCLLNVKSFSLSKRYLCKTSAFCSRWRKIIQSTILCGHGIEEHDTPCQNKMNRDNHGSLSFALKQSAPGGNVDKLNPGQSHQACGKHEVACWKGNKNDSPKGMTHMGLCQVSGQRKWKHHGSKRMPLQRARLRRQGLALTLSGWHLNLNFWGTTG